MFLIFIPPEAIQIYAVKTTFPSQLWSLPSNKRPMDNLLILMYLRNAIKRFNGVKER